MVYVNVHPIFPCSNLIRIGGYGLGGKWICDIHRIHDKKPIVKKEKLIKRKKDNDDNNNCLVYSIRGGGDYDDKNIVDKNSNIMNNADINIVQRYPFEYAINYEPPEFQHNSKKRQCEIHIFDPKITTKTMRSSLLLSTNDDDMDAKNNIIFHSYEMKSYIKEQKEKSIKKNYKND
jgi:hypothetical protein